MLIDADGNKKGLVPLKEAIEVAKRSSLDLVQVSASDSDPVVCKILDYGKHVFLKKKIFQLQNQKLKEILLKKLNLDPPQMLAITI